MVLAAVALAFLTVPAIVKDVYVIHILNTIGIYILLTTGLNLILGYAGQISVGHAAFFGIGAYTSALLTVKTGLSFWGGLVAAGVVAALFGIVIGPVLRLRGHVLAMATIAFGEIIRMVLMNWISLTNGPRGIYQIPPPRVPFMEISSDHSFFYLIFGAVFVNLIVTNRLVESRVGRIWRAIRDDQEAARGVGIPISRYKILAFAIGGFWAGVAGSLHAHLLTYISPHTFTLHESVKMLTMIIVGGEGTVAGSIVGAALLTILSEYLRFAREYNLLPYGLLLLLILIFAPRGIYGLLRDAVGRLSQAWLGSRGNARD